MTLKKSTDIAGSGAIYQIEMKMYNRRIYLLVQYYYCAGIITSSQADIQHKPAKRWCINFRHVYSICIVRIFVGIIHGYTSCVTLYIYCWGIAILNTQLDNDSYTTMYRCHAFSAFCIAYRDTHIHTITWYFGAIFIWYGWFRTMSTPFILRFLFNSMMQYLGIPVA